MFFIFQRWFSVFRVTCGKKPTESSTVQAELVCFSSLIMSIQIHVSFKVKSTSKQHKQKLWLGGHLLNLLTNSNHFITISNSSNIETADPCAACHSSAMVTPFCLSSCRLRWNWRDPKTVRVHQKCATAHSR
jgi:hypothetical protein